MTDLNINFLPWQERVWNDPSHNRVIVAGRRCGKTEYAVYSMLIRALTDGKDAPDALRMYIGPTFDTAKEAAWQKMLAIGSPVIAKHHINDGVITLINGQRIRFRGADRPEALRGPKVADVVLDEYADMKPFVWEEIVEPATMDLNGTATFIGTPAGRNHFYELYKKVEAFHKGQLDSEDDDDWDEWSSWHFTSFDNPTLDREKIERKRKRVSAFAFNQEYLASFAARGSEIFNEDWIQYSDEPEGGAYYIAVDLAGFAEMAGKKKARHLDDTAIAVVKVGDYGWWVKDIICGRWTLDMTAQKIFDAVDKYQPVSVGIERGLAKQAVMSPLSDLMRRKGKFFTIKELTHGNKNKTDRVVWALEGRFENGHVSLRKADWNMKFLDQLFQFPDSLTHDDMVDALAYIDQLAVESYQDTFEIDDFEFEDAVAGY